MSELKPCPFCGSPMKTMRDIIFNKVTILHNFNDSRQTVCSFKVTATFKDEAQATTSWNTRTDTILDTAMKLLRDNQSPMHFDREMTQADHDVLREARKWR